MTSLHDFKTSFTALRANKVRSFLTILGIVIGVSAIILIVSLGKGAENLILDQLGGLGADMIVIRPGQEPTGPTDVAETMFADSLKIRDVEALRRKSNVPTLAEVTPLVIVPGSMTYRGETYRPTIIGGSSEFLSALFNVYPDQGVLYSDVDIRQKASVAVIGSKVEEELFGKGERGLGKVVKIKDRNFRIVGVFPHKGQISIFNIDDVVFIPETTAQQYLLGTDYYTELIARAESPELVARTVRDIELTLRELHGITDPTKDDFFIVTQEGLVQQVGVILGALTAFLSAVVAISLVVGGIGVMNIMLVSVTERTKEIGLRKALGATDRDILRQFLLEAVILTGIGGLTGIAIGVLLAIFVSFILTEVLGYNWTFSFPFFAAALGFGVSALVGLAFGIYPARIASKKSPIEALQYE
jgi:putative ABC transport system permease protein